MTRDSPVARLNRTDPAAVWSFQGFAFVGWSTAQKAGWLKGFVDAVPRDHFNVIDMGYSGNGEWRKWDDASFFGAKFVWTGALTAVVLPRPRLAAVAAVVRTQSCPLSPTALMNFGGTNGIKGNLTHMNEIPFAALEKQESVWGSGFTSEGASSLPYTLRYPRRDTLDCRQVSTRTLPSVRAAPGAVKRH
jgi:hypothetical protein